MVSRSIHYFFLPLSRGVRPSLDILCGFANNDRDEAIIRAGRPRVPNHPSRARKGGGKYGWKGKGEYWNIAFAPSMVPVQRGQGSRRTHESIFTYRSSLNYPQALKFGLPTIYMRVDPRGLGRGRGRCKYGISMEVGQPQLRASD